MDRVSKAEREIVRKMMTKTNADRIRQMSDVELADRIMCYIRCEACKREFHIECNPSMICQNIWLEWLKSPASEVSDG